MLCRACWGCEWVGKWMVLRLHVLTCAATGGFESLPGSSKSTLVQINAEGGLFPAVENMKRWGWDGACCLPVQPRPCLCLLSFVVMAVACTGHRHNHTLYLAWSTVLTCSVVLLGVKGCDVLMCGVARCALCWPYGSDWGVSGCVVMRRGLLVPTE